MAYTIRKGSKEDVKAAADVYEEQLQFERDHGVQTNWKSGVYPTLSVAKQGAEADSLYVLEEDGRVRGSMILNCEQAPEYGGIDWSYEARPEDVLVIHTLCLAPSSARHGYGQAMVAFAEQMGKDMGCAVIRLDTWVGNKRARRLYTKAGFRFAGSAPAKLHGLIPLALAFFEKKI